MGLFDRHAEKGALNALRKESAIAGLTDSLHKLNDAEWRYAVNNLRDLRLLAAPDAIDPDELDCHPLLREPFGEQVKQGNPTAWREGNNRLYEYYKTSAKELPDTIQEMAPLFAAVMHGCQAGKHPEVLDEVYWKRIQRGDEHFIDSKLGAFGAVLAALSNFFDSPWHKPVDGLGEDAKGFVSSEAGFALRALSRISESAEPMQTDLQGLVTRKDWKNAAIVASNLSELYLTVGDVMQALTYAEQSIQLADQSGDATQRMQRQGTFGNAQHQMGHLTESQTAFHKAEGMQKKRD